MNLASWQTLAARGDLAVPPSRTTRYGQRCFAVSGPTLWNSLTLSVRDPSLTLTQFCASPEDCVILQSIRNTRIAPTQVNSALHPSGVTKLSTSFGWCKGGKVTSTGWQVTLCDLIWHVISRSGVVISITNCYIRFTLLFILLHDSLGCKDCYTTALSLSKLRCHH